MSHIGLSFLCTTSLKVKPLSSLQLVVVVLSRRAVGQLCRSHFLVAYLVPLSPWPHAPPSSLVCGNEL